MEIESLEYFALSSSMVIEIFEIDTEQQIDAASFYGWIFAISLYMFNCDNCQYI
jgi:hypothetical protein